MGNASSSSSHHSGSSDVDYTALKADDVYSLYGDEELLDFGDFSNFEDADETKCLDAEYDKLEEISEQCLRWDFNSSKDIAAYQTALIDAAKQGHPRVVAKLLEHQCDAVIPAMAQALLILRPNVPHVISIAQQLLSCFDVKTARGATVVKQAIHNTLDADTAMLEKIALIDALLKKLAEKPTELKEACQTYLGRAIEQSNTQPDLFMLFLHDLLSVDMSNMHEVRIDALLSSGIHGAYHQNAFILLEKLNFSNEENIESAFRVLNHRDRNRIPDVWFLNAMYTLLADPTLRECLYRYRGLAQKSITSLILSVFNALIDNSGKFEANQNDVYLYCYMIDKLIRLTMVADTTDSALWMGKLQHLLQLPMIARALSAEKKLPEVVELGELAVKLNHVEALALLQPIINIPVIDVVSSSSSSSTVIPPVSGPAYLTSVSTSQPSLYSTSSDAKGAYPYSSLVTRADIIDGFNL